MNVVDKLNTKLNSKQLIELARIAETAERYHDCYQFMSTLTKCKSQQNDLIDIDERNILRVSISNIIGSVRASLRSLNEEKKDDYYSSYKQILRSQLKTLCENAIDLITTYILPVLCSNNINNGETEVFFNKFIADLYRYLAEYKEFKDIDEYKKNAETYYQKAMDIARVSLNETHPTRLGLALNFSVFYNEILGDTAKGCILAKQAFDSSIQQLDTLNDASYKDSTLIMQLLRDNLTLWSGSNDDGDATIGFAVGGARDVNNFRECIHNGIMPTTGSITFNGLFYEYYFDTKTRKRNNDNNTEEIKDDGSMLFYPTYCYAKVHKTHDDRAAVSECYMTVGLNSNIKEKDFKRKLLNLCIVLDKSGSMSDCFEKERQSYYAQFEDNDNFGKKLKLEVNTKMEIANQCIVDLLKHLTPKDRFGLIVFDTQSTVIQRMDLLSNINMETLKQTILSITASGGTNFECGYNEAINLYKTDNVQNDEEYDNRVLFLTDAHPNAGTTNPNSLMAMVDMHSNNKTNYIYTTFIGVGLDFNTGLIEQISNTRGCNYYAVQSTEGFNTIMDQDFEFMVTPLVFDVCLRLKSEGNSCCIDKVYGAAQEMEGNMIQSGEITKINTLFPSKKSKVKGGTKGGIQLIKLKNMKGKDDAFNVEIEVTFEDKYGNVYTNKQCLCFGDKPDNDMIEDSNFYDNKGIRKGILLCKYGELLMNWIEYEEQRNINDTSLRVNDEYKTIFNGFIPYFEDEMKHCQDEDLQKELDLLKKLV